MVASLCLIQDFLPGKIKGSKLASQRAEHGLSRAKADFHFRRPSLDWNNPKAWGISVAVSLKKSKRINFPNTPLRFLIMTDIPFICEKWL